MDKQGLLHTCEMTPGRHGNGHINISLVLWNYVHSIVLGARGPITE